MKSYTTILWFHKGNLFIVHNTMLKTWYMTRVESPPPSHELFCLFTTTGILHAPTHPFCNIHAGLRTGKKTSPMGQLIIPKKYH